MDENKLNIYLDQIGRTELLTAEEEKQLAAQVKKGNQRALNKLVEANLRFVVSIANQYQGKGLSMDDLLSEGNIGLMKAAAKFDGERGLRFVNYAVVFIRQQIEKALKTETSETRLELTKGGATRSVDAPLGSKNNVSLLSVLVNADSPLADERVHSGIVAASAEYALSCLDKRETMVINAYFGIEEEQQTMKEIGDNMNLSRERVRQIRDKAIRRMRKAYKKRLAELREKS